MNGGAPIVDPARAWTQTGRFAIAVAVERLDLVSLVAMLRDRPHVHDVIHLVGDALTTAMRAVVPGAPEVTAHAIAALRERGWPGDEQLADQLETTFGAPAPDLEPAGASTLAIAAGNLPDAISIPTSVDDEVRGDRLAFADLLLDKDLAERLYVLAAVDEDRYDEVVGEQPGIADAWAAFAEERRLGRIRAALAGAGYRPSLPAERTSRP